MTTAPDLGQPAAAVPAPPHRRRTGLLAVLAFGIALAAVAAPFLPGHPLLRALIALLGLVSITAALTAVCRRSHRLSSDLRASQAAFRTLARSSVDPVVILDQRLRVTFASPGIAPLLGHEPAELIGLPLEPAIHPDDRGNLFGTHAPRGENGEFAVRTARVRTADGQWRLVQATVRDLRADPDAGALVLHCRDVTSRGRGVDPELLELSLTDPVTGLPNRTALSRRLAAVQRQVATAPVALVLLSLDGLAAAAARPGTEETVLRVLTARLTRELRGEDWLARGKNSDFVVLVDGTVSDAEVVATRLITTLGYLATPAGPLTATAGVTGLAPDIDPGEALRRADIALYSARTAGVGSVHRYDNALRNAQDRRSTLAVDLAGALERGELRLAFQPVVDVVLHRTVSVEALLRWRHPELGDVSPQEFVPLAEESPLITELGRWVLVEACGTVATTDDELSVAVNVSARQVRSGELVSDVVAALESSRLAASRLIVEITESMLLDEHVAADLETLRGLGVRIAVDDFGTGFSSLAYLVGMPVDLLKMDQHFLADVETDPQRRALCRAILQLGTSLGLPVIVEGVATPGVLALMSDMGHRYVQGYAFSRPLEVEQLAAGVWRTVPDIASAAPEVPA
ncbi:putative bifunctional diguanylate cyclase/phosphodiesterase [Blastococcus atacamensis]|uniref:putative bifunctional diguanylate cyclase/phosphodiesterase n=1 Tax=Blastococcus atacamensis TaxID=2070508 RepID=UPI0018E4AF7E|nr:GGDEF domain-containing phosphodiesterase [Blastococcus atacamensis]